MFPKCKQKQTKINALVVVLVVKTACAPSVAIVGPVLFLLVLLW